MGKRWVYFFDFAGWLLFLVCSIVYTYGSWKGGDPIFLTGSLIFLVACISFMIPMIVNRRAYLG
ncbi:hypothetical protein NOR51B_601 [Luminiphilus syltensis NOR5-1B]|uniref:Cytochrome oxidase subunit III n=1 Tax=Luminiphilus syltensis NOR5-1B TaxID=565045 RepID=B8KY53_9GAMM|nr:hypothetical protein [Luminiphilus syltensis]EED34663.1 hypothetical protein NOR51B_601 [Luminiphilus syltensis NOR5-1B]